MIIKKDRTSYAFRLWRLLEEIQAQVELPEKLDNQITHVLWHDHSRLGEPNPLTASTGRAPAAKRTGWWW